MQSPPIFKPRTPLEYAPSWVDDRFLTGQSDAEWHRKNTPNLSLTNYARGKRRELAKTITSKTRIYLDQQYWIHCRNAAAGLVQGVHFEIWKTLLSLVQGGRAACPISSISLTETFKQADLNTRRQTAEVMDELSAGIALRSSAGRRAAEFELLWRRLAGEVVNDGHRAEQAFTWLFEVFGALTVAKDRGPSTDWEAIGKAMFDTLGRLRFPDLLLAMPELSNEILFARDHASRVLHDQISAQNSQKSCTFEKRLHQEIEGVFKWLRKELMPVCVMWSNGSEDLAKLACESLVSLVSGMHANGEFKRILPTFYLRAVIYAAIDHKHRHFDDGDMFDHDHAIAALPYCQVFLTEKKLGTLLTEKPAQLDKEYGCRVLWNADEVLAELITLTRAG